MTGVLAVLLLWEIARWPDVEALASEPPETTAFLEAARARGETPRWQWVPYDAISDQLKHAVLVGEDIDFFSHRGFAVEEIKTAIRESLDEGRRLRGASTLTQQLAKNLWLSPSRNPWRKVKEAILTWQLERSLDKRRILELYLNVVEFGPGVFGAEAAARQYFGISAAGLSRGQAASLAASLPHSGWYPGCGRTGYERHRERILGRMERSDWLESLL